MAHRLSNAILSRNLLTTDDVGEISLVNVSEIQNRLDSLHATMTTENKKLSDRVTNEVNSLKHQLNTLNSRITSIDRSKQHKGNYMVRGEPYQLQIRSHGGDNALYSIDYWNKNGRSPAWVKNGRVSSCGSRSHPNHRCVILG